MRANGSNGNGEYQVIRHPVIDFQSHWDREQFESRQKAKWPESYFRGVVELRRLVDRRAAEPRLQDCLERHPYLLPGIDALSHGPLHGIIATKFPLGNEFRTDFAFVTFNSQESCITCVEIESAGKGLFKRDGTFSREYLDAKQQIVDWLFWAHHHVADALNCWQPMLGPRRDAWMAKYFRGILVFGRRREICDRRQQERWSAESLAHDKGLTTMTYDRLLQERGSMPYMDLGKLAVCTYRGRRFVAKSLCL